MAPDKNQSANKPADQQMTEQVSHSNESSHRPNWIIPDKETHNNKSNRNIEEQQQDISNTSMGNDETLGIP